MLSAPGLSLGLKTPEPFSKWRSSARNFTVGQEKVDLVLIQLISTETEEPEVGKGRRCSRCSLLMSSSLLKSAVISGVTFS